MLDGRDYLFGDFGIVDVTAFPFVKYATDKNPDDHSNFHQILRDWQPIEGRPRVEAWIAAWTRSRAPRRRKRRARSATTVDCTRYSVAAHARVEDRERTVSPATA